MIPNAKLTASDNAIKLIKEFEKCDLEAYLCPSKKWTIGWGHTGQEVHLGMKITQEQADQLLAKDVTKFENFIKAHVERPLTQQQFDALICFAFNNGDLGTSPLIYLNMGQFDKVPGRLKLYVKGGEPLRVLPGLQRRREWEINLWNTGKVFGPLDWPAKPGRIKYL